jgi:hypothetical protein
MQAAYHTVKLSLSETTQNFTTIPIQRAIILLAISMVPSQASKSVFALLFIFCKPPAG